MATKEKRSVHLDSISIATIEKYATGHNVSFSEAVRDLVRLAGDTTGVTLNKLVDQSDNVAFQVKLTGKVLDSFEQKTNAELEKIREQIATQWTAMNKIIAAYQNPSVKK